MTAKYLQTSPRAIMALCCAAALSTACATSGAGSRSDDKPVMKPPAEGEEFHETAELPPGPDVLPGYDVETPPETPAPATSATSDKTVPTSETGADEEEGTKTVSRAALNAFLSRGPRHALTMVRVKPAFENGAFVGSEVLGFAGRGADTFGKVLTPGDIILKVNERSIARPEDYMSAWNSLKECEEIKVELMREGSREVMSIAVKS